jgi:hypothetical protein
LRLADANGFIGKLYVQAVLVGSRINGNGFDAHFAAGADDPEGNFPPVGDQYFLNTAIFFNVLIC